MRVNSIIKDRYKIIRQLGSGGMSEVFLCEDLLLHTYWAGKYIEKEKNNAYAYEALRRETELLVRLKHTGLPMIVDCFDDEEGYLVIMELIKGISLRDAVVKHAVIQEQIWKWSLDILHILHYLHHEVEPAIIYRDLKPENIMLDAYGHIKLIDFGTALRADKGRVRQDVCVGTKGYAPKEQMRPGWIDCRSDIYAYGATLYFLHTRQVYRQGQPIPPSLLHDVMETCLKEQPEDRYQSVVAIQREFPAFVKKRNRPIWLYACGAVCLSIACFSDMRIRFLYRQYHSYIDQQAYEEAIELIPSQKDAYLYAYEVYKKQAANDVQPVVYALRQMERFPLHFLSEEDHDEVLRMFAFDCMRQETADFYYQASVYFRRMRQRDVSVYVRLCDLLSRNKTLDYLTIHEMEDILRQLETEADQMRYTSYSSQVYELLFDLYNAHADQLGAPAYNAMERICDKGIAQLSRCEGCEDLRKQFYEHKILLFFHQGNFYDAHMQKAQAQNFFQMMIDTWEEYEQHGFTASDDIRKKIEEVKKRL